VARESPLLLGLMLDTVDHYKIPVHLVAAGLKSHTVVVAQSGSGKSFLASRIIEEIASKTKSRILVIDSNSDFVKLHTVDRQQWKKRSLRRWFARGDTLETFESRWNGVGIAVSSRRFSGNTKMQFPRALLSQMCCSWSESTLLDKALLMEYSRTETPSEHYAMERILEKSQAATQLHSFVEVAGQFYRSAVAISSGNTAAVHEWAEDVPPEVAKRVWMRARELAEFDLWDSSEPSPSISQHVCRLLQQDPEYRVLVLDLPSLTRKDAQAIATRIALDTLWREAEARFACAIDEKFEKGDRIPIFVVVDEAHHLAPSEAPGPGVKAVTDMLARIATEGRKYSLFLLVITQRPSQLHPRILSQCDNICLMKMNNWMELELVKHTLGVIPPGWAERAMTFQTGDALVCGNWVSHPTYVHVSPRRTTAGDGNQNDNSWARDPSIT